MTRAGRCAVAVFGFWVLSLVAGLLLSLPWFSGIGAQGVGRFADGELVLIREGGAYFLEMLRLGSAHFQSLLLPTVALGLVTTFIRLIPIAALIVAVVSATGSTRSIFSRACGHWFEFSVLRILTFLIQGAVVLTAWPLAQRLAPLGWDIRQANGLSLAVLAVAGCLLVVVGCLQDLVRVLLVERSGALSIPRLIRAGWNVVRTESLKLIAIWTVLAGVALLLAGLIGAGSFAWVRDHTFAIWCVQQLLFVALILLKLFWFSSLAAAVARERYTRSV